MIVKIVNFDPSYTLRLGIYLDIDDSGFKPASWGVVGIYPIVDAEWFVGFPLGKDAIRTEIENLVISGRPPRVVDVGLLAFDVDDFSIDPLVFGIPDVDVLALLKVDG